MNQLKRKDRAVYNTSMKIVRAEERRQELVALGKSLVPGKRTVITGYEEIEVPPRGKQKTGRKILRRVTEVVDVFIPSTGPKTTRGLVKEPTQFRSGYGNSVSLVFLGGKSFPHHGAQHKTRPGEKELHASALLENEAFVPTPKTPDILVIDPKKLPEIGVNNAV
jgi:hypothetical protein